MGLAAVGFVGMVLETLLLLRYQMANGIVYQQVGWLLTCFMSGMAAGAYVAGYSGQAWFRGGFRTRVLMLGAALAAWVTIGWVPSASGLFGTSVLLAAVGVAVGATFAAAASQWHGRPSCRGFRALRRGRCRGSGRGRRRHALSGARGRPRPECVLHGCAGGGDPRGHPPLRLRRPMTTRRPSYAGVTLPLVRT